MLLPKVTVIIPYSKDRGWLELAIQSVYAQSYPGKIELILSESDGNVAYNLNQGIKAATGEFIKYLCDDDKLTPNSIEDSVKGIGQADFIHGRAINFRADGWQERYTPAVAVPTLARMLQNNVIHGGTLMYRRDVFDRFGLFDETLDCAEEYEFNLRIMSAGASIKYVNSDLYLYRRHDDQKSLGKGIDQHKRKVKIDNIKNRYT